MCFPYNHQQRQSHQAAKLTWNYGTRKWGPPGRGDSGFGNPSISGSMLVFGGVYKSNPIFHQKHTESYWIILPSVRFHNIQQHLFCYGCPPANQILYQWCLQFLLGHILMTFHCLRLEVLCPLIIIEVKGSYDMFQSHHWGKVWSFTNMK